MNLMLASMLQRGSNEVDIKEKSQDMDAEGSEGGSGFSALMAELAEQESASKQVKESADPVTLDLDAPIDSEVASDDAPQADSKAQASSSKQQGEVPTSTVSYTDKGQVVVDKPLPDLRIMTCMLRSTLQNSRALH